MKVALVYDRANRIGGAERILLALGQIFPEAPLFTTVCNLRKAPWAKNFKVRTSFLQNLPLAKDHHELYAWLAPAAFESFDLSDYDLVISLTSAEAKAVITRPETLHVCYCLTPTRYLWGETWSHFHKYPFKFSRLNPVVKTLGLLASTPFRLWDQVAAQRPDVYLAISQTVQERIKKYYGRKAKVIYPPVDTKKFKIQSKRIKDQSPKTKVQSPNTGYFLTVSRLVPYKRLELAVAAFNQLGLPLVIVGEGPEKARLKKLAKPNIIFTGGLTETELISYYQNCQALVFPGEEDFGLVMVEAQAAGKPVLAYRGGGAREIVKEGKTGSFFQPQTAEALEKAVVVFKPAAFLKKDCQANAERFNSARFKKEMKMEINRVVNDFKQELLALSR